MCFSPGMSFAAGAALTLAGVGSIKKAKKEYFWIALVPVFFAIQQLTEGFQWLADKPSTLSMVLGYVFLFFAFLIWPIWVPFAIGRVEKDKTRQIKLKWLLKLGVLVSLYLLWALFTVPLSVSVYESHILYDIIVPYFDIIVFAYIFVICTSFFMASDKKIRFFGLLILLSALFSIFSYYVVFASIWCFWAALLSILIYFYLKNKS